MNKYIEKFENKLSNTSSVFERIIYTEAIVLLNDDVNPDKVLNWTNSVIANFENKPKPLTAKEKLIKEQKNIRKAEKLEKIEQLNKSVKQFITDKGVVAIALFDYNDVSDTEYEVISELSKAKNYFFNDFGDGAAYIFISKEKISHTDFREFDDLIEQLDLTSINKLLIHNAKEIINKIQ